MDGEEEPSPNGLPARTPRIYATPQKHLYSHESQQNIGNAGRICSLQLSSIISLPQNSAKLPSLHIKCYGTPG
jgi:hypothetical protein